MLRERNRLRIGFIGAMIALVVIAVPLVVDGVVEAQKVLRGTAGAPLVRDWLGDRDLEVTSWLIDGDSVTLNLTGSDAPPDAAPLAAELAKEFGVPVDLQVNYVALTREKASAAP